MADDVILETRRLTRSPRVRRVKNWAAGAPRHDHALMGPTARGRRTCFNLLTHFLAPTRAHPVHGREITGSRPADIARLGLVRSFQISRWSCTSRAGERARGAAAQARRLVRFLAVRARARGPQAGARADRRGRPRAFARTRRWSCRTAASARSRIATTLALDPEMMLLDEPTAGMAHEDVERISALIKRVAANRTC